MHLNEELTKKKFLELKMQTKQLHYLMKLILTSYFCFIGMPVYASDDGLANRPPMGWNCYHWFGTMPSESIMKQATNSIVSSVVCISIN